MGMFDSYKPQPPIPCPKCGVEMEGWQGKSGPCALLEWVQGLAQPRRPWDDDAVSASSIAIGEFLLPDEFEIYTDCRACGIWVEAQGSCDAGVWTQVDLVDPLEPPGLPGGWMPLRHDDRQSHAAELRREIGAGHILHGCKIFPLSRRRDRDEVLVRASGATAPLWVVQLTWREGADSASPRARPFLDLAEFVAAEGAWE